MLAPVGKCRVSQGDEGQQGASRDPVGECGPPESGHGAVTVRMHPALPAWRPAISRASLHWQLMPDLVVCKRLIFSRQLMVTISTVL